MESLRHRNEALMQNILPIHVIDHFLQVEHKDETVSISKTFMNLFLLANCHIEVLPLSLIPELAIFDSP